MTLSRRKGALLSLLAALLFVGCAAEPPTPSPGDQGGKSDRPGGEPATPDAAIECQLDPVAVEDADLDDFSRLLELATTLDWPAMEVEKLSTGCAGLPETTDTRDELASRIAERAFGDLATDFPEALVVGELDEGGAAFAARIEWGRQVIHERIDDGLWDPAADAEGAELFGRLDDLVDALTAPVEAGPEDYLEIGVKFENAECSEDAVGLFNRVDGALTVVHRFPRC